MSIKLEIIFKCNIYSSVFVEYVEYCKTLNICVPLILRFS